LKIRIQMVITADDGQEQIRDATMIERNTAELETVGLTLAEGKTILKRIQEIVVEEQANDFLRRQRCCPECGKARPSKGNHQITFRTVFGNLRLKSPRLHHCSCRPQTEKTFSPLAALLPERTSPELLYLETKWASLVSYGVASDFLNDISPVDETLNPITIRRHLFRVAERTEQALGEEQWCFVEGCQRDWNQLPIPHGPLTVALDGGFIRAQRKKGWFEVIVGKSILEFRRDEMNGGKSSKCFGFVQTYDNKPKRRLFELLKSQGMQQNQQVVFLSDGGDDVRDLPMYLARSPSIGWTGFTSPCGSRCSASKPRG